MLLETQSGPLQKALLANASTASFPARPPTVVEPINDGVIDMAENSAIVQRQVLVIPYGLGGNDDTFSLRVLGWRYVGGGNSPGSRLWVPVTLGEFGCVLGALGGIAGSPILNTELFADTLTVVSEGTYTADVTRQGATRIYSPANDTVAHLVLPMNGFQKIEFIFDQTLNTPTMNALIAFGNFD